MSIYGLTLLTMPFVGLGLIALYFYIDERRAERRRLHPGE